MALGRGGWQEYGEEYEPRWGHVQAHQGYRRRGLVGRLVIESGQRAPRRTRHGSARQNVEKRTVSAALSWCPFDRKQSVGTAWIARETQRKLRRP
eukprot:6309671-Lingulodinium_polyedra.AAC.1